VSVAWDLDSIASVSQFGCNLIHQLFLHGVVQVFLCADYRPQELLFRALSGVRAQQCEQELQFSWGVWPLHLAP